MQENNYGSKKGLHAVEGSRNSIGEVKLRNIAPHYRDYHCSAVNFAWVASGKLSAVNFIWDTLWVYVSGTYIVKQAGGTIYDSPNTHIAANNESFLQILKENTMSIDDKI